MIARVCPDVPNGSGNRRTGLLMDLGQSSLVALAIVAWFATAATGAFLQWVPSPSWIAGNRRLAWILAATFGIVALTATAMAVVIERRHQTMSPKGSALPISPGETCAVSLSVLANRGVRTGKCLG